MDFHEISGVVERFWKHVSKSDGCWEWTGGKQGRGYGDFWISGQGADRSREGAHRFSYMLHNGAIPLGQHILHHCDNPLCVNPEHLYAGTDADNKKDMVVRGRAAKGERNGPSKWNDEIVREIRKLYAEGHKQVAISKHFGVPTTTVANIVHGRTWGHVK